MPYIYPTGGGSGGGGGGSGYTEAEIRQFAMEEIEKTTYEVSKEDGNLYIHTQGSEG